MSAKRGNTRGEKIERALFLFFRRACSRASRSPNAQAPVVQARVIAGELNPVAVKRVLLLIFLFVLHCSSHSIIRHVTWSWSACHPVSSDSQIHPLLSDSVHCKPLSDVVRRRWLGVHDPISLPYLRTPTCLTNRILRMAVMQLLAKCGTNFLSAEKL